MLQPQPRACPRLHWGPGCCRTCQPPLVHEAAQLALGAQGHPALQGQLQPPPRGRARAAGKGVAHIVCHPVRALQQQQHLLQASLQQCAGPLSDAWACCSARTPPQRCCRRGSAWQRSRWHPWGSSSSAWAPLCRPARLCRRRPRPAGRESWLAAEQGACHVASAPAGTCTCMQCPVALACCTPHTSASAGLSASSLPLQSGLSPGPCLARLGTCARACHPLTCGPASGCACAHRG